MSGRRLGLGTALVAACAATSAGAAPPISPVGAVGGPPNLPAGKPGTIAVVAQGRYGSYSPGTILPVVLRNNTRRPVSGVHVAGSALDAKGRIVASGQDDGVQPATVPAGGLALGYLRFGGIDLPAGTRFRLDVTDTPAGANVGFSKEVDLTLAGLRYAGGRVTGTGTNTGRRRLSRPFVVLAACFARSGSFLAFGKAFGRAAAAAPGGRVPFGIDLTRKGKLPAPACAHVLVSMIGYSEL